MFCNYFLLRFDRSFPSFFFSFVVVGIVLVVTVFRLDDDEEDRREGVIVHNFFKTDLRFMRLAGCSVNSLYKFPIVTINPLSCYRC